MKRKGLSRDEKKEKMLRIFHEKVVKFLIFLERMFKFERSWKIWLQSRDWYYILCFNLLVLPTIRDILDELVSDNLVD